MLTIKNSENKIKTLFFKEISNWTKFEKFFFVFAIILVIFSSTCMKDSILSILSAFCGIIYTILAGKGKVYCYFFGIIGTLSCAYLSFDLALYGNFVLHLAYYFPMEIIGFFTWRSHIDKKTNEIIKEKLSTTELTILSTLTTLAIYATYEFFLHINDQSPFFDASMSVLSVTGMILTVRRSIEQWLIWTLVNFLSIILWFEAYEQGEKIFSIFAVRIVYFILGIYFFYKWKKSKI